MESHEADLNQIHLGYSCLTEKRCFFSFEAGDFSGLPRDSSTRHIFQAAIERDQGKPTAGVLTDLFRYLFYGNFAVPDRAAATPTREIFAGYGTRSSDAPEF